MAYFHYRCGERITLLNDNCTALRNDSDFDNGLVITADPIPDDVVFEIKIDKKVNSWWGSLELGVVDCEPMDFEFPACSTKVRAPTWIMSSTSFFRNGGCVMESYGSDLDKLGQDDRVGVMRTSDGDLIFYVNGVSQGVACENVPPFVYGIVDVFGKCVQVTITNPSNREPTQQDDCLSGSSVLAIENDNLNVTLGGDLSELSMSSSNSLDIRMDMNASLSLPEECPRPDKMRFHDRCGALVKLTNGNRSAERRRPLDEFNNGVVMTNRALRDMELFEIRIDRLVDKWSGSIEMGITTHNPGTLVFPATMTNMRSGTIMMSGCGILTNGKGTRREYGDFNLDELSEGDRIGMMRKSDGNLHYFINGLDQGVAAQRVPTSVWGVVDLYGMTIKVSIVERDEREEQNLITRKNTRDDQVVLPVETQQPLPEYYNRLTFHTNCGTHAQVINNGRTAHRPNAADDFNNGVVLTARPLKTGEMFEIRLDRIVTKWAGSIEIGVTSHSPVDLEFPFTMTNVRSGTWMMTGSGIMHNGTIVLEQYGVNLDRLQVGDRVGVIRKDSGLLHFFVNGIDQGPAASNVPEGVFGVIDLYGQAVEASIVDSFDSGSPDTVHSSMSNTTLYSDLRFHHVHGKNARIINGGSSALRPRPLSEFNDAIVFSNRPLRDGEIFEVSLDSIVDRWSGSIEIGVTAVKPDDIELPGTATDLSRDTWMLSGSSVMENGTTIKNNYPCDLDSLGSGTRVGVVRNADKSIEFYKDGVSQGTVCTVQHPNIYAVVDLYGQCAQVSIPGSAVPNSVSNPAMEQSCQRSDTSASLQANNVNNVTVVLQKEEENTFAEHHGKFIVLSEGGKTAKRHKQRIAGVVAANKPLVQEELFEIIIGQLLYHYAGSVVIGLTEKSPSVNYTNNEFPYDQCILTFSDNRLRYRNKTVQFFSPSFDWLVEGDRIGFLRTQDATLRTFINGDELPITFPKLPDHLYVVVNLRGRCSAATVITHKSPHLPILSGGRLQDSLEIPTNTSQDDLQSSGADLMPIFNELQQPVHRVDSMELSSFQFHENHGRNVELSDNRTVARRVASYNQGVVVMHPALEINSKAFVVLEEVEPKWNSSLIVGLISGAPEKLSLPATALGFKAPCCVVAADWVSINGVKNQSTYGQKLDDLRPGDRVGVVLAETGLKLIINDCEAEVLPVSFQPGQLVFAVFDLYGQCVGVKILNEGAATPGDAGSPVVVDLEKGDLESCEKDRLTLPIPSASTSLPLQIESPDAEISVDIPKAISVSPPPMSPEKLANIICLYKEEVVDLKNKLLLPDCYFAEDPPICYCTDCFKIMTQGEGTKKENCYEGFVRFILKRQEGSPECDNWHRAFYPTKIGIVRGILDVGQPLTKGQSEWGLVVTRDKEDVVIALYPTLQHSPLTGFTLKNNRKKAFAAFEVALKPDTYVAAKETHEWESKEAGAIVLNSLLLQVRP